MPTKNTIRRNYLIIKRILRGDYPSKHTLLRVMSHNDTQVVERTLQRDLANIRSNYDIGIEYDSEKGGYFVQKDTVLELDKLLYFIALAESSDLVLATIKDSKRTLQYLSISPSPQAKGVENIGCLLQAMQKQIIIQFAHLNYQTKETKDYTALPYLLKEFDGMWYLFAYVERIKEFRTFGLDRISNIIVTDNHFTREKTLEETAEKFNQVYGLVYEPDDNKNALVEEVKLKVSDVMLNYLNTLPLHHSQIIEDNILSLNIIINPELENKIISYGEHIEILSPQHLRDKIKQRLTRALNQY